MTTKHDIFYLKTKLTNNRELSNCWAWLLFLFGPLLGCGVVWWRKITLNRNNSDSYKRLMVAKRNRNSVIKHLEDALNEESFSTIVNSEVVPLLNDALNLPPGATGSDICKIIKDEELKNVLDASGQSSFMPGSSKMLTMEQRNGVVRALKKLIILMLCICSIGSYANSFDEAIKLYDQGDFVKAAKIFDELPSQDVSILYNRGLCYYMLQNYSQALLWLERAYRLEPRDTTIVELLNLVRQKLNLPMVGMVNSPLDLVKFIRNSLRPNEWLLVAAIAWFLIFVILICFRMVGRNFVLVSCGGLGIVVILAIASYIVLEQGLYNRNMAIIVGNGATLRSLPSKLGSEEGVIPAGHEVIIEEQRSEYSLIKIGNIEGWTKNSNVASIENY